jgi:hypothetical protein
MAAQIHSTAFLPRTISLGLSARDRYAIERQIEELLDAIDGDADLEEDDFPGDEADWEMDRTNPIMLPRYGVDQSTGPINFQEAEDAYLAAM